MKNVWMKCQLCLQLCERRSLLTLQTDAGHSFLGSHWCHRDQLIVCCWFFSLVTKYVQWLQLWVFIMQKWLTSATFNLLLCWKGHVFFLWIQTHIHIISHLLIMIMENPNLTTYRNQLFLSNIKKKHSLSSFLLCEAAVAPKEYRCMHLWFWR